MAKNAEEIRNVRMTLNVPASLASGVADLAEINRVSINEYAIRFLSALVESNSKALETYRSARSQARQMSLPLVVPTIEGSDGTKKNR